MNGRGSGILLPITSLPSPYGIGDLGPSAYGFVDFLNKADQKYWQILPLNPTTPAYDNSPYLSPSAFAGNTLLISPELMMHDGFLDKNDCGRMPGFPQDRVDYKKVTRYKKDLFSRIYEKKQEELAGDPGYIAFCRDHSWWLEDYTVFMVLSDHYGEKTWNAWPEAVARRRKGFMDEIDEELLKEVEKEKFLQYIFFRQWNVLHRYCKEKGIHIIGDLPIYVNFHSADVWANPDLFRLDERLRPAVVSGVPPDYFSKTGQLWNNPLYNWEEHERTGFSWWTRRFRQNFSLFDQVRVDHFRGLVAYWEVPAGAKDATGGRWVNAPAEQFLQALKRSFVSFPVIAEDLGVITPDVHEIMQRFNLPGMRVLQFAFTDETADNPHAPHNLSEELVLYTGTHDNSPVRGWYEAQATAEDKQRLLQYLGREYQAEELPEVFIRLAMMSVAKTVILPMQDILGLGDESRMNTPGTDNGNWRWRMSQDMMTEDIVCHLRGMTTVFGRKPGV
jgi:4-alpha-glucanotransferase